MKNNIDIVHFLLSQPKIEIGEEEFWKCNKLKQITIPDTIKKIPRDAFFYCESLIHMSIFSNIY